MRTLLIADTHFNHTNVATYCDRPKDFTQILIKRWNERVQPKDTIIHLGDVFIGSVDGWKSIWPNLPGKKILIRGNHDRQRSCSWWMDNGFDFACDGMIFRGNWLTHEPAQALPPNPDYDPLEPRCQINIHGHLHNIWHGFAPNAGDEKDATELRRLRNTWQRLFAVEYTNYYPIEFDEFLAHPDKYQARGPKKESI